MKSIQTPWFAISLLLAWCGPISAGTLPLQYTQQSIRIHNDAYEVRIPVGYRLDVVTTDLKGPRLMTFNDNGDLFIGSRSGNVYRLKAPYRHPSVLVTLSDYPHSIAIRDGELLIAQTHGLYRAPYQPNQRHIEEKDVTLLAPLPGGAGHNSRTVAIGPDGRIYTSLGISGNCSDQYLGPGYPFVQSRGGVLVLREAAEGSTWETFASGLRNPVGFDWQPASGDLYASNNGPDHLGFDKPPEYFSRLEPRSFHGMPWFQFDGRAIRRDSCIKQKPPRPIEEVHVPVATFPARNAPMGVAFIPKGAMDKTLEGDAVVALRGSWGTQPTGGSQGDKASRRPPKLVVVRFKGGEAQRVDDLVTGFQLSNGSRWARPVGVALGKDGALYFTSDSGTNGLFRLRRDKNKKSISR